MEIKFRQIAVQVLLATMLVCALHSALKQGKTTFGRNGFVVCVVLAEFGVPSRTIGHELGFAGQTGAEDRREIADSGAVHMECAGRTELEQLATILLPNSVAKDVTK